MYSDIENSKEEYYVWNVNRDSILKNIIVYDESRNYTSTIEEPLNMFYDSERQILAKVEDNRIYALEEKEEDNLILEEYIYTIKSDKAQKELVNTYEVEKEK